MDGQRFDRIARAMGGAVTRRTAVGGFLTVVGAAALGATGVSAAKGGNGKGQGHGKANGHNKVAICHALGNGGFQFKRVPPPALKGHGRHGDTVCTADTACATATGCDATGNCIQSFAASGTACVTDAGSGTCDGAGNCLVV
ncbi:MAG TPA: hypothetical protein VFU81_15360 [Thermomicrobiales bacterium]|nr:hypothetical protein [Thermomicrobiales bacterium]